MMTKAMKNTRAMNKCYSELITLQTFDERFKYLRLNGQVASETFGVLRWLNQIFYRSPEWKRVRREIIIRDQSCDLGIIGQDLFERVLIHHINPITIDDIRDRNLDKLLNPENLITTVKKTHDAIHYGSDLYSMIQVPERRPNDTIPWR